MEQIELNPRCLQHESHSVFIGPDGYVRPCCFVNNTLDWDEFLMWASDNDLKIKDLQLLSGGMDAVINSKLWLTLKKQLEDKSPNCPSICKKMCSKPTSSNLHKQTNPQKIIPT